MTFQLGWWGPWFPDAAGPVQWWSSWFPDGQLNPTIVTGVGPAYVAALALSVKDGMTVRYEWDTNIIKKHNGVEQRIARLDLPRRTFQGNAYLVGSNVEAIRGYLARYAAQGQVFLLGVANEALVITANTPSKTISVSSTSLIDWCVAGQRVVVIAPDESSSVVGVIQSSTSNSITIDVAPGATGNLGGRIMPGVPVYLDPQQGFQRYPQIGALETWRLNARSIMFGYETGPAVTAFVALSGYTSGVLANAVLQFIAPGSVGNTASLQMKADGTGHGSLTNTNNAYVFHFQAGTTALSDLLNALFTANANVVVTGQLPSFASTFANPADVFAAPLAGGTDKNWGTMGLGATVNTYQGAPLWDRGLDVPGGGTVSDSMQSMAELLDLGATITEFGPATVPDWGRQLSMTRNVTPDWQWLKAFLNIVRGRQVAFWLPTYRADLTATQLIPGTLTISASVGDFFAWYPSQRTNLMLVGTDGSIQYLNITGATAGSTTIALAITSTNTAYNAGGGGATWTAANIALVSWMDLCRFESDQFDINVKGSQFSMNANARAVQA